MRFRVIYSARRFDGAPARYAIELEGDSAEDAAERLTTLDPAAEVLEVRPLKPETAQ